MNDERAGEGELTTERKVLGQLRAELAAAADTDELGRWVARTHIVVGAVFDEGSALFLEEMARAVAQQLERGEISLEDARMSMAAYLDSLGRPAGR